MALVACEDAPEKPVSVTPRVKVFKVGKRATGQARQFSGKVQAAETSTLSFGVDGTVADVFASVGKVVSKGAVLATLDPEPLRLAAEQARAKLLTARASLDEARSNYDRIKGLFAKNVGARKNVEAAEAALATANGNVRSAQKSVERADLDFARTKLTAPFDGTVASVPIDAFQQVGAQTEAVVLQAAGKLEVSVLVPETLVREVSYGQIVKVRFPTLEQVLMDGSVSSIGAVTEAGNAFPVKVRLVDGSEDLRPGMTASIAFNFDRYLDGKSAFLVPLSSIAVDTPLERAPKGAKKAPVYVLDETKGVLTQRWLSVGNMRGNEVEVFDGLAEGDLLVTAGVAFLRDGMAARAWKPRVERSR